MDTRIKGIFIFLFGAVAGAFATYRFMKQEEAVVYRQPKEVDVDEVKEDLTNDLVNRNRMLYRKKVGPYVSYDKPKLEEIVAEVTSKETPTEDGKDEEEKRSFDEIYLISVDEFVHDKTDYDKISLSYFKDNILADDRTGDIVEEKDIPYTIGVDAQAKIGPINGITYDEVIYVRNDRLEIDYEISREPDNFYPDTEAPKEPEKKTETKKRRR
jgi:hypothetical protein